VFSGDGHLNAVGHRVLAEALSELIERRHLLAK
jgi:lysophospholipase L1-like esterase